MVSWSGNVPYVKVNGTYFQTQTVQFSTAEHKRHFDFKSTGWTVSYTYGILFLSPNTYTTNTSRLPCTDVSGPFPYAMSTSEPPERLVASLCYKINHKTHMQRSCHRVAEEKNEILAKTFSVQMLWKWACLNSFQLLCGWFLKVPGL